MRQVAIVVFDDVEVLDFAGPFEVFAVAGEYTHPSEFKVFTVSQDGKAIRARNGLQVQPDYGFANCPHMDILIIPGGAGTRPLVKNEAFLAWVKQQNTQTELTLSVCTGSLVLAACGLLQNQEATTHITCYDELRGISPTTHVKEGQRFVDIGHIITSAGISAGIDMSLYVVKKLAGEKAVKATVDEMEYLYYQND
jgi:transcriptional regulator GlxA family with amidase domain